MAHTLAEILAQLNDDDAATLADLAESDPNFVDNVIMTIADRLVDLETL